jgi:copper resistance protein B
MNVVAAILLALTAVAQVSFAQEGPSEAHSQHKEQAHDGGRDAPTESELRHVPPDPPGRTMSRMSSDHMIELMGMDDGAGYTMLLLEQLEWGKSDGDDALLWDAQAWYGDDYNKAWFKTEGESVRGDHESRNELLWDRIVTRWWNLQAGVRHDVSEGPSRTWAAFGVQGLAPYWFDVEATLYVGEQGRTALRASAEYDLLLTQRLILQPEVEINMYGKDDPANAIGSGFSDMEAALRLRYEIRREFAPYIGVAWTHLYGDTADLARAAGRDANDLRFLAGLRVWF